MSRIQAAGDVTGTRCRDERRTDPVRGKRVEAARNERWSPHRDVGATLLTDRGNVYTGVCIDTGSGSGYCAEHSAIAAMVTAGECRIAAIVAVWRDERDGKLYVLPPCGRCRVFILQIDESNLETDVVLGKHKRVRLKDLLPYHDWPEPLEP